MASLTRVSIISRKIIRYGIYLIIFIVIARFSIRAGVAIYKRYNPEPPPPPTVGFGKLSELPFPEQEFPEGFSYSLETPEGGLPNLLPREGQAVPVYFMPKPTSSLDVVDQAAKKAASLGFQPDGEPLTRNIPNIYVYKKSNAPQSLLINIITGIFSISYDLNTDRSILEGIPPAEENATETVKSFLGNNLANDIRDGRTEVEFLRTQEGQLVSASSLSEAEVTKVNLFRKNMGDELEIPSMTPEAVEANVWFNVAGNNSIVNGEYHYYSLNEEDVETYPIISAQQAYEKLQAGEAYLANLAGDAGQDITIRRVYLAYYDAGQYSEFYQPIVVFEGDDDFYAYVPAVTSEFYGE